MSVAVVIPAHNAASTLTRAIRTVQSQTRPVQEIVVVDDHSEDGTADLVSTLAAGDHRIRLVRATARGSAHARNVGVCSAGSEVIAFLDADDVWYPDKIATQLAYLHEDVAFVGGLLHYLGADGSVLGSYLPFDDWDEATASLRRAETMPVSLASSLVRRADLIEAGGFDESFLRSQDLELAQRLVVGGRRVVWPPGRALGGYVLHAGGVSVTSYREQFLAAELVRARVRGTVPEEVTYRQWQQDPQLTRSARRALRSGEHYRKAAVARGSGEHQAFVRHAALAVARDPARVLAKLWRRRRHEDLLTPSDPPTEVVAALRAPADPAELSLTQLPVVDLAGLRLAHDPLLVVEAAVRDYVSAPRRILLYAAHVTSLNDVRDEKFVRAFNLADAAYVDGISWSLIAAAGGHRARKMATTDLAPLLMRRLADELGRPVRVAVLGGPPASGSAPSVAARAGAGLERDLPVQVVMAAHGYHEDWSGVLAQLGPARPDVVLLGLGMPLEAHWCRTHGHLLPAAVVVTCGGWLRILAGEERRAPVLAQRLHLEWLHRIAGDPSRTLLRYARGVTALVRESARAARRRGSGDGVR